MPIKDTIGLQLFNIYCSYKSHLSYRMSEYVKILSGPVWIVFWFGEGFFIQVGKLLKALIPE
jgi:hypothetical protein